MKSLAIIFSVIVMMLAIVPCCAFDNCGDEQVEQQHSGKPETPCSPFVHCTCSAGICIAPVITLEYVAVPVIIKNHTHYHQSFTSNYCSSIWQPPKITC